MDSLFYIGWNRTSLEPIISILSFKYVLKGIYSFDMRKLFFFSDILFLELFVFEKTMHVLWCGSTFYYFVFSWFFIFFLSDAIEWRHNCRVYRYLCTTRKRCGWRFNSFSCLGQFFLGIFYRLENIRAVYEE